MRTIIAALCGVLAASAMGILTPAADAQTYTIKYVGDDASEVSTAYIGLNAVRKKGADSGAGEFDVIDIIDRGTVIFLNHGAKTYRENSVEDIKNYLDQQSTKMNEARMRDPRVQERMRRMGVGEESTVEKLGPGENIAGYPTERYRLRGPMMQAELWITQSLQFPAAYYRDFNILSGVSAPFGKWDKIIELKGAILKRVVTIPGGMTLSETATSVDKASIPASIFEVPAGYKQVPSKLGRD